MSSNIYDIALSIALNCAPNDTAFWGKIAIDIMCSIVQLKYLQVVSSNSNGIRTIVSCTVSLQFDFWYAVASVI